MLQATLIKLATYRHLAEWVGVALAVWATLLETRERVLSRPLSAMATAIMMGVYYAAGLYVKCYTDLMHLAINLYGWYRWQKEAQTNALSTIRAMPTYRLVYLFTAVSCFSIALTAVSHSYYSDVTTAYIDCLCAVLSLCAQCLMTLKYVQAWVVWIGVDLLYGAVCWAKGLYVTALLYSVYLALGCRGLRVWKASKKGCKKHG